MFIEFAFRVLVPFAEAAGVDPEASAVWDVVHDEIASSATVQVQKKIFKPEFVEVVRFNQLSENHGWNFYVAEVNVAFEIEADFGANEGDGGALKDSFANLYSRVLDPLSVAIRNFKDAKWDPWAKGWDPVPFRCELKGIQVTPVDVWGDFADYFKSTDFYANLRKQYPLPTIYSGQEHY